MGVNHDVLAQKSVYSEQAEESIEDVLRKFFSHARGPTVGLAALIGMHAVDWDALMDGLLDGDNEKTDLGRKYRIHISEDYVGSGWT